MPTYVYACKNCGHRFEQHQSFSDDALTLCPVCHEPALRKVFNSVGIVFKGSGFYKTDSRSDGKGATTASDSASTAKGSGGGSGSTGGDTGSTTGGSGPSGSGSSGSTSGSSGSGSSGSTSGSSGSGSSSSGGGGGSKSS